MAITTYSELQTAITTWMDRPDFTTAQVKEMIALAEARFNRLLKTVETEAMLTGTSGSRTISISALSMVEPIALKVTDDDGDEREITPKPYGTINYLDESGDPSFYEISGTNIKFDVKLDSAYSFRFIYKGRFALSDSATTNNLLTDHPDIYLAGSIVWGGLFTENDPQTAKFKAILEEGLPEVQRLYAQQDRTVLTPDPMFGSLGRSVYGGYNGEF